MSRTKRCLTRLGFAAVVAALAGCPGQPVLKVEPLAISFSETQGLSSFRILNPGSGTLTWQVSEDLPWLSLARKNAGKAAGLLEGSTTSGVEIIDVLLDREALQPGLSTGDILVSSNGGSQIVRVSASEPQSAQLIVSTAQIDMGNSATQSGFQILNEGQAQLDWTISVASGAPWLKVTPAEGHIPGSTGGTLNPDEVTVLVDRSGLTGGGHTGTINITSNGGTATVTVTISVATFSVDPPMLDFGTILASEALGLTVTSNADAPITLSIQPNAVSGGPWLSVSSTTATLQPHQDLSLTLQANPAGLEPGSYEAQVTLTDTGSGDSVTVPVSMVLTLVTADRSVIDFGAITEDATDVFVLSNLGAQPVAWDITVPQSAAPWLSVAPASGLLQTLQTITVAVSPGAVDPGVYETDLTISFLDTQVTVTVLMTRPKPAALQVAPNDIDFGTSRTEELVALWNDGIGTVNWRIDTAGFPDWLSLSPVGAGGIASGTLSGDNTATVTLAVDRTQIPADQFDFSYAFDVEASGDTTAAVPVAVRMTVPLIPVMVIEADGVDATGVNYINLDTDENDATFFIRNEGTGTLSWNIELTDAPKWITAVNPSQGSLDANVQKTVTVSVDRSTLDYLGDQTILQITSNDPERPSIPLLVEIQVSKIMVIRTRPSKLSFGLTETSSLFEVSNFGDPETVLNFQITSSKDWLSVFPESGSSIGTNSTIKDWKSFGVSVDRSQLDGQGASAKLTVTAYTVENGVSVPLDDPPPVEVDVSVEAIELTIETPKPRLRIPSLVRFVLLMRNIRYQALPIPQTQLETVGNLFAIYEKDTPLELTETNQFLTSGNRLRTNVLVLLDFSGSMQEAARKVDDPSIANAPDPLLALYRRVVAQLIDELPGHYRVGLGVFNDRIRDLNDDQVRLIRENADAPIFIRDKAQLQSRLQSVAVQDNGATQLYDVLQEAVVTFAVNDLSQNLIPFDDADVRALVCVTDGRVTSTNLNINDVKDWLQTYRVRFFCVGWGDKVVADPLIRLTTESGGHYYATRNDPTGGFDPFGAPIRVPVAAELEDWFDTDAADPCDQSIAKDLKSQVVLSYVTLSWDSNMQVEGRITFNDPNDQNSPCLDEQGDITGTFTHRQLDYGSIAGDNRLGQISMQSEELTQANTARVVVRAEYVPRNVDQFSFDLHTELVSATLPAPTSSLPVMQVAKIPSTEGGLISDWIQTGTPPVYTFTHPAQAAKQLLVEFPAADTSRDGALNLGELQVSLPGCSATQLNKLDPNNDGLLRPAELETFLTKNTEADSLRYGDFGDLLALTFTNVTQPFRVHLDVLAPQLDPLNADSKYFTRPDTIQVGAINNTLDASQGVPATDSVAIGYVQILPTGVDDTFYIRVDHTVENPQAATITAGGPGEGGAVLIDLGVPASPIEYVLTEADLTALATAGTFHLVITSAAYPEGEIFGHQIGTMTPPEEFLASAFPSPFLAFSLPTADLDTFLTASEILEEGLTPESFAADLGTEFDALDLSIYNLGGNHAPTGVGLAWTAGYGVGTGLVALDPFDGYVTSTLSPDTLTITVDRLAEPGFYFSEILITYVYGTLGLTFEAKPIVVLYEVAEPQLTVAPQLLNFGPTNIELPFTVTNTGQSYLSWYIDDGLFPYWLTTVRTAGGLGPDESTSFNLRVARTGMAPGAYSHDFTVEAHGGHQQSVSVQMIVP